jgi:hypothetical protein
MSAAVGADIAALCSKCGDVWHVIVAKVGEQIVKVQCKECGGYHRYKSPAGAKAAAKKPSTSRPREPKAVVEKHEAPAVAADLSKPVRRYSANDRYEVGERVEHPTFGQGVVETTTEPGKMTVFFASGRKVLVHDKGAGKPGLEKPRPFDHAKPDPNLMSPGARPPVPVPGRPASVDVVEEDVEVDSL